MIARITGEKNKRLTEKGITLIALVVTIVVLLILAGVSMQMLAGQTGILRQAQEASKETNIAEYDNLIKLAEMTAKTEKKGSVTLGEIIEEIYKEKIVPEGYIIETGEEKAEVYTPEGYIFEITGDTVKYIGKVEIDDIEKMKKSNYMIKKGEKREYYEKLLEAYNSVDAGGTILVLKNVEETETIESGHSSPKSSTINVNKDITIDTGIKKLTINSPIIVDSGTFHIKGNGEIYCKTDSVTIKSYGGNIETSEKPTIRCYGIGLKMEEGNGTLTLNGGYIIGEGRSGMQILTGGDIVINNTTILGLTRTKNAISLSTEANNNITIKGNSIIANGVIDELGLGDTSSTSLASAVSIKKIGKVIVKENAVVTTRFASAPITVYDNTKLEILDNASIYCSEISLIHGAISLNEKSNISIKIDTTGIIGSQSYEIFSNVIKSNNTVLELQKGKFTISNYNEDIFSEFSDVKVPECKLVEERDIPYYIVNSKTYKLEPMVMSNYYYLEY